jgi:membrane protein HdeD
MADAVSSLTPASKWPLKLAAVVAIALGVLALISPFRAGIAATLVLAWSFLIGGCLGVLAAFRIQRWTGTYGLMLLSIVSILAGLVIFGDPLLGLGTVTLVCIAGLFAAGITKVFWGFKLPAGRGRWLIVLSGALSIVVAGMLYWHFPFSAAWAFGVLVGITLIFEGISHLAFLHSAS